MEQKIFIPYNATVYVIGAPCSGKTTLGQRIEEEANTQVRLISPDEIFESMFGISATRYAMLPPMAQRQYIPSAISAEALYTQKVKLAMADGLMTPGLLIFEAAPKCMEEVASWVKTAVMARMGAPVIVLKMEPSDKIYRDFCQQRSQIGECLPAAILKKESALSKEILHYDYSRFFRNVVEYHVRDPRAVKLEFIA